MKKLLLPQGLGMLFLCFLLINFTIQAQNVLNGNFESWTSKTFEVPDVSPAFPFNNSNYQTYISKDILSLTKISNGGGYAMRLETVQTGSNERDTAIAYAIWGSNPGDGGVFPGGFPFTDQNVTGISADLRYDINAASPGLIIVQFKKDGVPIGGGNAPLFQPGLYIFMVSGSQSSFSNATFNFSPALPEAPDTVVIAFASNNPFDNTNRGYPGNFLEVDNIVFTGTSQTVPGGNLDTWIYVDPVDLPDYWHFGGGVGPGHKTTDAYSGNYAIEIKTNDFGSGSVQVDRLYLGTETWGFPNTYIPGAAVTGKPQSLNFYYKYTSPGQDTASMYVRLSKWDGSSRINVGDVWMDLILQPNYSGTYAVINYLTADIPDSIFISFHASRKSGADRIAGSVLRIDDVSLNYCDEAISILGNNSVCANAAVVSYTVQHTPGASYNWNVPAGSTITDGQGTNTITVHFGSSGGLVSVNKSFSDGCPDKTADLNVNVDGNCPLLNYSFEYWTTKAFEVPDAVPPADGFVTSNYELLSHSNVKNMTKISRDGGYAMRLETVEYLRDGNIEKSSAYALWSSSGEAGGDPIIFQGGFPFSDQNVTGLRADMRYNIDVSSPGLVLLQFKKNGVPIDGGNAPFNVPGLFLFPVSGSQSEFTSMTFNFSLSETPDTCVMAFASNNPFANGTEVPGNFLEVDNIQFINSSQQVPAGNLDNWVISSALEIPDYWKFDGGFDPNKQSKTTDAHSGNYALQLAVVTRSDGTTRPGVVMLGRRISGTPDVFVPGAPVGGRPQSFNFWYKYTTPGIDTAMARVVLSKWDGSSRIQVGEAWTYMLPQSQYTSHSVNFNFYTADIPDSVFIEFVATKNWQNGVAGSVLKLDDISFNICGEMLTITGNPAVCENAEGVTYSVQHTEGSTYSWTVPGDVTIASGDGTNTITVNFGTGGGTISVTKTYADGCADTDADLIVSIITGSTADAGSDQLICANMSALLNGSVTGAGGGTWTGGSGTFTPNANTLNATYTPSSSEKTAGTVTLTLNTTGNGNCVAASDQMTITITQAPSADAGPSQTICATAATVNLSGSVTAASGGTWTSSGNGTFGDNGSLNTTYAPSASDKAAGSVTLTLTTTGQGTCAPASGQTIITITPAPTSNAGPDQTICAGSNATMNGSVSNASGSVWTSSGTGTFTPDNLTLNAIYVPSAADITAGMVTCTLSTTGSGVCAAAVDYVTITINSVSASNAGADQAVCAETATLSATVPAYGTGEWSVVSGSGTVSDPSYADSDVTGLVAGSPLTLRWTISNAPCAATSDDVIITRVAEPSVADAGDDQSVCAATATLNANLPGVGTGEWTVSNGAGTVTTPSSPNSGVTGLVAGSPLTLRWTISNSPCSSNFDDVVVTRVAPPTVANAGADQTLCAASATLSGNTPLSGTGEWSVVSGSGNVTNPSDPSSGVTGLVAGDPLTLTWTISNTPCAASADNVTITGAAEPTPADAGSDQTVCAATATLAANTPANGTGMWTKISGAGTIDTPSSPTSGVSGLAVGSPLTLRWTISNAPCAEYFDDVVITRIAEPTVANAGADQTVCASSASLSANTPSVGTGMWSVVSGTGTVTAPGNSNSTVTGLVAGSSLTLKWTISNASCTASEDEVIITRQAQPVADAGVDQEVCEGSPASLNGFVNNATGGIWTTSGSGTFAPNSTTLNATYSPSAADITAGCFTLTLTSTGNGACSAASDQMQICITPQVTANAGVDQEVCSANASLIGNDPGTATGIWTLFSGTGTITDPSDRFTTVTGLADGDNVFRWTLSNSCFTEFDEVTITKVLNAAALVSVSASANPACAGSLVTFTASPVNGGDNPSYQWKLNGTDTGTDNPVFSSATLSNGDQISVVMTSDLGCATGSPATSNIVTMAINAPPTAANAGADNVICAGSYTLNGNTPASGTGQWSVISGSATVTTPVSPGSGVSGIAAGASVTLRWTISNAPCTASSDEVTIIRAEEPTTANAGIDQSVCAATATLNANIPLVGTGAWTVLSGAGSVTDPGDPGSGVTGLVTGSPLNLRWTISNAPCTASVDDVVITRGDGAEANAGPDQVITATMTTLDAASSLAGTGVWTVISGTGTFADNGDPHTEVTGLSAGANVFRWTVTTDCGTSFDEVTITANPAGVGFTTLIRETKITTYPNPFLENITLIVGSPDDEKVVLQITDMNGRFVDAIKSETNKEIVFGTDYPQGVYFVQVFVGERYEIVKLIKL